MRKICAVPGSDSGIGKTIKQRKSLGLRRVSLVSVPKNEDRRRQWKNALSCELDINQCVCEFQFSDDVLKKCERTVMLDGSIYESPLVRWRLQQNAVPKSEQGVPMDCKGYMFFKPGTNLYSTNFKINLSTLSFVLMPETNEDESFQLRLGRFFNRYRYNQNLTRINELKVVVARFFVFW